VERLFARTGDEAYESFAPRLWPERFDAPYNTPLPRDSRGGSRNVFVNSLGDLFGPWVEKEHVEEILAIIGDTPQWNYLILTKHPNRCLEFSLPRNVWLGVKVDQQKEVKPTLKFFGGLEGMVRFISCDPLLEWLDFPSLSCVEWVIVGARDKTRDQEAFTPPRVWVSSLMREAERSGCKVYVKHWKGSAYKRFPGDDGSDRI
jgi:protein gp37